MYEGKITGIRPPTVPPEELGRLMAGSSDEADSEAQAPEAKATEAEAPGAGP
jgi:hypothetical protein